MPHWRPLATASTATLTAAVLALSLSGGHSPFAVPSPATQPVANDVAGETASPEAVVASDDPTGSPAPDATAAADPTAKATARPKSTGSTSSTGSTGSASSGASRGSGATSDPTAKPTPRTTPKPTPKATPTPAPTASPTAPPVAQTGTLHVSDNDAGPRLSWTQCSASNFAAYAVVRSLDSEIHYPAEDKDTVVAIIPTISTTALTDTGAPNSKVYYAVWCLSRSDGEYKTIWKTPVVGYAP